MSIFDTISGRLRSWILGNNIDDAIRARMEYLAELQDYYYGKQKKQLTVKPGRFNDNLTVNLCALIVDKAVSALVGDPADGQGLTWTFESETEGTKPPQIQWLEEQWKANKQSIFLHDNALIGAQTGFPSIKLVPDGAGNIELINLDPITLTVDTDPQNKARITAYHIRYNVIENSREVTYREDTLPNSPDGHPTAWTVETKKETSGKDIQVEPPVVWPYPFPPILAWKNLPNTDSVYGCSDIENVVPIQDRYNFVISNLSKIIRLDAHPQKYARNLSQQIPAGGVNMGPDEMLYFSGDGEIGQLPPVGDMPASIQFMNTLRDLTFSLAREVDTSAFKDKVGAITNMGLRMMYKDALEKLGTKRMLYGDAYVELNRRLLILGGYEGEECKIDWPDPLPTNQVEDQTAISNDLKDGLVSKQTASEKRGYDWEQEQERMGEEASQGANAGAVLLNQFLKTGGTNAIQNKQAERRQAESEVAQREANIPQ
jgi:hypothetical protein